MPKMTDRQLAAAKLLNSKFKEFASSEYGSSRCCFLHSELALAEVLLINEAITAMEQELLLGTLQAEEWERQVSVLITALSKRLSKSLSGADVGAPLTVFPQKEAKA